MRSNKLPKPHPPAQFLYPLVATKSPKGHHMKTPARLVFSCGKSKRMPLRHARQEANAGAMCRRLCWEAARRGGGQARSAEADQSRGRLPVGSPIKNTQVALGCF